MEPSWISRLTADLLLILAAGLASGIACKRLGLSMLVGYLVAGALLGDGGLGLVSRHNYGPASADGAFALEYLAHGGALILLFSIGIEFSLPELVLLGRPFLVGGTIQMVLVAVPTALVCVLAGIRWNAAILIGFAVALSSTVLVYKALEEWGQAATPYGRRAVAILLYQDIALVPLMLLLPALTGRGTLPGTADWLWLATKSALFLGAVLALRYAVGRWAVPLLAKLRSVELVVLFTLILLGGVALGAREVGLPPALGALAAGLVLGGSRLSGQIDAVILPFRETFAALFFTSLGTLMRFDFLAHQPHLALAGLVMIIAIKTAAAAVALRAVGLAWRAACGMGLGLAQLGELSFVLLSASVLVAPGASVIDPVTYHGVLFIALCTLALTPQLLKIGLTWAGDAPEQADMAVDLQPTPGSSQPRAAVIGMGPIGGRVASHLETSGLDVCLIDLSPVNLHPYAQQGFRAVSGDASDPEILRHANVRQCRIVVVSVPDDATAHRVVLAVRGINGHCQVLVRCRYQSNIPSIRRAGATVVVSEEAEAAGALLGILDDARIQRATG